MNVVNIDLESHTDIFGRSSAGKTYLFREVVWRQTKKRIVFLNTQHEHGFGPWIRKWDVRLLAQPGARVNLIGPRISAAENGNEGLKTLLARVVDDCFRVGERAAVDRSGWVIIAVDESHLISPKGSPDDPLQRIYTNGHRHGVKGVTLTQRPALLSHTVLSQAPTHVLFDLDDFELPYLRKYGVPEHAQRWIREPLPGMAAGAPNRRFAVRTGTTWHLCAPIDS